MTKELTIFAAIVAVATLVGGGSPWIAFAAVLLVATSMLRSK